jgi:hypothetical protein
MPKVLPDAAVKSVAARGIAGRRGQDTDDAEYRSASLIEQPTGKLNLFFCNVRQLRSC